MFNIELAKIKAYIFRKVISDIINNIMNKY